MSKILMVIYDINNTPVAVLSSTVVHNSIRYQIMMIQPGLISKLGVSSLSPVNPWMRNFIWPFLKFAFLIDSGSLTLIWIGVFISGLNHVRRKRIFILRNFQMMSSWI